MSDGGDGGDGGGDSGDSGGGASSASDSSPGGGDGPDSPGGSDGAPSPYGPGDDPDGTSSPSGFGQADRYSDPANDKGPDAPGYQGFGGNSLEGPVSLPGPPATPSLRSAARGLLSGEMREENVAMSGFLGAIAAAIGPIGIATTITDIARALGLSEEPAGLGPDTQDPGGLVASSDDRVAPGSPYAAGPTITVTVNDPARADFLPQGAVLGFGGPYRSTAEQVALASQLAGNGLEDTLIPASDVTGGEDWVPLALAAAVLLAAEGL